jgi:hypothetical protein
MVKRRREGGREDRGKGERGGREGGRAGRKGGKESGEKGREGERGRIEGVRKGSGQSDLLVDVGVVALDDVAVADVALDRELDGLLGGGDGNCVADGGQIAHDALELGCRHLDRGLVLRVGDAQVQRFRLSTIPYPPSFP